MKIPSLFMTVVLVAITVCALQASVAQQSTERVIRRLPVEHNEPITITQIKVNDQPVSFNEKFTAGDEWLRGLVVSIKNTSNKRILFASIQLQFQRPVGSQDKMSVDDIFYGNWSLQMKPSTPSDRLVGIGPDETVTISISDQKFLDLRRFLTETGFPKTIETLDMRINSVIFEDDIMWTRGKYLRRDPNNPMSWKL